MVQLLEDLHHNNDIGQNIRDFISDMRVKLDGIGTQSIRTFEFKNPDGSVRYWKPRVSGRNKERNISGNKWIENLLDFIEGMTLNRSGMMFSSNYYPRRWLESLIRLG